jgi:hypothetical protein
MAGDATCVLDAGDVARMDAGGVARHGRTSDTAPRACPDRRHIPTEVSPPLVGAVPATPSCCRRR